MLPNANHVLKDVIHHQAGDALIYLSTILSIRVKRDQFLGGNFALTLQNGSLECYILSFQCE